MQPRSPCGRSQYWQCARCSPQPRCSSCSPVSPFGPSSVYITNVGWCVVVACSQAINSRAKCLCCLREIVRHLLALVCGWRIVVPNRCFPLLIYCLDAAKFSSCKLWDILTASSERSLLLTERAVLLFRSRNSKRVSFTSSLNTGRSVAQLAPKLGHSKVMLQ